MRHNYFPEMTYLMPTVNAITMVTKPITKGARLFASLVGISINHMPHTSPNRIAEKTRKFASRDSINCPFLSASVYFSQNYESDQQK